LTQSDYLELPNVESTLNRCLPCNKTFPNSLRYRIHIKDVHDKKEPTENYDAENCAQPEDFICIICVKKFVSRKSLKNHIYKTHLGINPEDEKSDKSQENQETKSSTIEQSPLKENKEPEEQDPLADPLDINESKHANEESILKEDLSTKTENENDDVTVCNQDENSEENEQLKSDETTKIKTVDITSITKPSDNAENTNIPHNEDIEEEKAAAKNVDAKAENIESEKVVMEDKSEPEDKNNVDKNIDNITNDEHPKTAAGPEQKSNQTEENNEDQSVIDNNAENKGDDDIVIIEEPKPNIPPKVLSEKEKKLIDKMLNMLKKYGCAFCSIRFDTKYSLSFHERSHLKEKKSPKKEHKKIKMMPTPKKIKDGEDGDSPETPKVKKNTKMGSVQLHDNVSGPVCFKCSVVCKDNSNYKNHILSHYYREFDPHIPQAKPFECPICEKPSRDKITLIRHYAFTHQKMFELTDITPEQLIPPGSTPKTPRARPNKSVIESKDDITPKVAQVESPIVTETSEKNEESTEVQSNGVEDAQSETEAAVHFNGGQDDEKEVNENKGENLVHELKETREQNDEQEVNENKGEKLVHKLKETRDEDEQPMEVENSFDQNESNLNLESYKDNEDKAPIESGKMESLDNFPSDNKENEEEIL